MKLKQMEENSAESKISGPIHLSFSQDDAILGMEVQDAITQAHYIATGLMNNQEKEWFQAWNTQLQEAVGAGVLFTDKYRAKIAARWTTQGEDAALYKEAMAIRARQKAFRDGRFVQNMRHRQ